MPRRADKPKNSTDKGRAGDSELDERVEDRDEELDDAIDEDGATADDVEDEEFEAAKSPKTRTTKIDSFWEKLGVEPLEIALPRGVGYTLRAYRMSDLFEDEEPADAAEADEEEATEEAATAASKKTGKSSDQDEPEDADAEKSDDEIEDDEVKDDSDEAETEDEDSEQEEEEEEEEEEARAEPEEIPIFLIQDQHLLLFRSPEGLVEFVRSEIPHDLDEIEEWETLRSELTPEHVVPSDEDRYELDLVVENLRGGHDAWDSELIIKAGEVCRDLGHALKIESVVGALAPGSPLDDLDEALRAAENGRIGAFFSRRKLRRVGAQQAALAWRSIIGKISTSVDWRD